MLSKLKKKKATCYNVTLTEAWGPVPERRSHHLHMRMLACEMGVYFRRGVPIVLTRLPHGRPALCSSLLTDGHD